MSNDYSDSPATAAEFAIPEEFRDFPADLGDLEDIPQPRAEDEFSVIGRFDPADAVIFDWSHLTGQDGGDTSAEVRQAKRAEADEEDERTEEDRLQEEENDRALRRLKGQQSAKRIMAQELLEGANGVVEPGMRSLRQVVADSFQGISFRMDRIWPIASRINLFAEPKAGKSTMAAEFAYSLLSGEKFMGHFDVMPLKADENIIVFDYEASDNFLVDLYKSCLADYGDGRINFAGGVGTGAAYDFTDPERRAELAEKYKGHHTFILDCASPLLADLGMDENSNMDVQMVLTSWDAFVKACGGKESIVVHHTAKTTGKPRGATAWTGSGAANLLLTVDGDRNDSPRYFSVMNGRGTDFPVPHKVELDKETGRLTMGVKKSRAETSDQSSGTAEGYVNQFLAANPNVGYTQVWQGAYKIANAQSGVKYTHADMKATVTAMVESGDVLTGPKGTNNKVPHFLPGQTEAYL